MKKRFVWLALLIVVGLACNSVQSFIDPATPILATSTDQPTSAVTQTSEPSASPTAEIFVREGTPVPDAEIISVSNADELIELARWGTNNPWNILLSADQQILFAQTRLGVSAYDTTSKELLWRFEAPAGIGAYALDEAHNLVAVGDDLGMLWLLDAATGELMMQWDAETGEVYALAFSEDGNWLAVGGYHEYFNVAVWELPAATLSYTFDASNYGVDGMIIVQDRLFVDHQIYELHSGERIFNGRNNRILKVFADLSLFLVIEQSSLSLRDLESGEEVTRFDLEEDDGFEEAVAVSADGTKLALGYYGDGIEAGIWSTSTGEKLAKVVVPESLGLTPSWGCYGDGPGPYYVYALEFSPDGNDLSIFTGFDEVILWNTVSGALRTESYPAADPVYSLPNVGVNGKALVFSQDGAWLASGENLWQRSTGLAHVFSGNELLGFSGNGQSVYAYQNKAILRYRLFDFKLMNAIQLGEESRDECSQVKRISPNGGVFFEGGYYGGDSYLSAIWALSDASAMLSEPPLYDVRRSVIFSADGTQMIVFSHPCCLVGADPDIVGYDLTTREELFSIDLPGKNYIVKAALSTDNTILAGLTRDGGLVWDLTELENQPVNLMGFAEWPSGEQVAMSPDGNLVAADTDDIIAIWDAETGELLRKIEFVEEAAYIYDLAFSPDGRYLAALASDGAIHIWGVPAQ